MGLSLACIRDIEWFDDELFSVYSPNEVQQFCKVLGTEPSSLFGIETNELPVTAPELVQLIQAQCSSRAISLEQFEDAVGWTLSGMIDPPEKLLQNMSIDGLQDLCRELEIDWQRVILSL